ncbi:Uncharacterized protein Fot_28903 [Forsythia ovata]|uniref:Uncharacterized protein n=1 Tax=Forsythia ovata TaxID=205694 RepID=A0ABD1TQB6_9LAMI
MAAFVMPIQTSVTYKRLLKFSSLRPARHDSDAASLFPNPEHYDTSTLSKLTKKPTTICSPGNLNPVQRLRFKRFIFPAQLDEPLGMEESKSGMVPSSIRGQTERSC